MGGSVVREAGAAVQGLLPPVDVIEFMLFMEVMVFMLVMVVAMVVIGCRPPWAGVVP